MISAKFTFRHTNAVAREELRARLHASAHAAREGSLELEHACTRDEVCECSYYYKWLLESNCRRVRRCMWTVPYTYSIIIANIQLL